MDISVAFMVGGVIILLGLIIGVQQRSIERLTNKVMAKDYREYSTSQKGVQGGREAKMDQLSWFDDPHEVREDTQ